jgi:uncharacterized protein YciI
MKCEPMRILVLILVFFALVTAQGQPKRYTFVFLHHKPSAEKLPKDQVERLMNGHLANIERLAKEGKLIVAGPFEGGGGIFILNTTSTKEAQEWLSSDPGIQSKRWDVEMLPFSTRIGSLCLAKEPYEMVTYRFIRLTESQSAPSAQLEEALKKHQDFVSEQAENGNLISEGVFEPNGNVLILRDTTSNNLESDPAVKQGFLSAETKKLWIAKGSFCEK